MKILVSVFALCSLLMTMGDDNKQVSLNLQEGQKSEPIDIKEFAWMAGAWEGKGLGGNCVETWSSAVGGAMCGSFLYSQGEKVIFTEHFVLSKQEDSVTLKLKHFDNAMSGWEEKDKYVEFKFVKRDGNRFHFNGLTYVQQADGSMEAYVLIKEKSGKVNEAKFEFKRVK